MKLLVDFSGLWMNVKRMGDGISDFSLSSKRSDLGDDLFDTELSSTEGIEIDLSDLEVDQGVLSIKGRQVLLFIPDQGSKIEAVLQGERHEGKRFHIADCKTLENMKKAKRFDRYMVTNNLTGRFKVYGWTKFGANLDGDADLNVCQNCLKYLNYKNFSSLKKKSERYERVNDFNIVNFLTSYSTLFKSFPREVSKEERTGGYGDDWKSVSQAYRASLNYQCESCNIDLSDYKNLLHTHHVSGNKRDNRVENLKALCVDCHRKQPLHGHMFVKHKDMKLITRLRHERGGAGMSGWKEVFAMADSAVEGLLLHYQRKGEELPHVGYALSDGSNGVIAELEIAWPSKKRGVAISAKDFLAARKAGWEVLTVGDAIRNINA